VDVRALAPGHAQDAFPVGFEEGLAFRVVFAGQAVVVPGGSVVPVDERLTSGKRSST
jgi:hypothetical protein